MSLFKIIKCIFTNSRCYKAGKKIKPRGIVVHSTGANNPELRRYVQPNDGLLGDNEYGNHWNQEKGSKCMHAFIGKLLDGSVATYQTLPWNWRSWGCGKGKKGSYNDSHIQFEICEDGLQNEAYYKEAFRQAAMLCAYLCKEYSIPVSNIVSHHEAARAGYASDHVDPGHWMDNFGENMDTFRAQVAELLGEDFETVTSAPAVSYDMTLRKGGKGEAVEELQKLLLDLGYKLPEYGADGDYGSETVKAVKKFQSENGLDADGICGPKTWAALRAATSNAVYCVNISGLTKLVAEKIVAQYGGEMIEEG